MATDLSKPLTREEMYLSAAADITSVIPDKPYNRKEMYLNAVAVHVDGMEDDIAKLQAQVAAMATDMKYKGAVDYVADLPTNAKKGDVYTVRYKGTTGTEPLGAEYVYSGTDWIQIGHDMSMYATTADLQAEITARTAADLLKQDKLTAGFGILMSGNTISVDDVNVASVEYVDANITDTMNFIIQERNTEQAARIAGDNLINTKTGDLADLDTTDKTNLVAAINEVAAGAGGDSPIRVLTEDDYDYTYGGESGVAIWNLSSGLYYAGPSIRTWINKTDAFAGRGGLSLFYAQKRTSSVTIVGIPNGLISNLSDKGMLFAATYATGAQYPHYAGEKMYLYVGSIDSLDSTETVIPLSANQGKVLKDTLDARVPAPTASDTDKFLKGDGTWASAGIPKVQTEPDSSTVGALGDVLVWAKATHVAMYVCTAVDTVNNEYTWQRLAFVNEIQILLANNALGIQDSVDVSNNTLDSTETTAGIDASNHALRV